MFNIFLINNLNLTKYIIGKDSGVNHASKKDIVSVRMARAVEMERHISSIVTNEYRYQPTRLGRIMDIQGKDVDLVAPLRNTKRLMG